MDLGGSGERSSVSVGCPECLSSSSRCKTEANACIPGICLPPIRLGGAGGGRPGNHTLFNLINPRLAQARFRVRGPGARVAGGHGEEALLVCGVVFFRLFGNRPSDPSKVKSCRARHPRSARFHPSCWLIFPLLDPASSQVASCDGVKRLSVSGRVTARAARGWVPF